MKTIMKNVISGVLIIGIVAIVGLVGTFVYMDFVLEALLNGLQAIG